jgi:hypothetical protein
MPRNLPVGTSKGRSVKKGNSTRETVKKRSAPRFYEVKIRLPADEYLRGLPFFDEPKYLPKFFIDAYAEKVNRAESNSKAARLRKLMGDVELLDPVIKEMYILGKLDYLNKPRKTDDEIGGENGI